jgi:hypothetical protein
MPLPFIPSSPRRRLYEPEATRGGEMGLFTNSSRLTRQWINDYLTT